MKWENLSKPLEELGKWILNIGLVSIAGLIIQPLIKGTQKFIPIGLGVAIISALLGFSLILISELLKGRD